jgi:hypothetical protein
MATAAIANQISRELSCDHHAVEPQQFVAVPGGARARWLLPAKHPEIGSVLESWTPYRLWSRVAWAAVKAAIRFGRLADIPGVSWVEIEELGRVHWAELGWQWPGTPIPVIYLGTPGPRRKAVVHLVDRQSARCRAIVKVPLTDEARAAVIHEAGALDALERERREFAPRLLHMDRARGISTQTFVEGRPGTRQFTPECWRLLHSLLLPGETTSLCVHAVQWAQEVERGSQNPGAVEAINRLRDDTPLPACWEHGDFTPWNVRRVSDERCALLDWEDANRNGLPLMDAYHFLHMQDFLFGPRPRLHADELRKGALGMGIAPNLLCALEIAYLVRTYLACVKRNCETRATFVDNALTMCRRRTD